MAALDIPAPPGHSIVVDASRWGDDVCGHRGADNRPLFEPCAHGNRLAPGTVMWCGPASAWPGNPAFVRRAPAGATLRPFWAEVSHFGKRDTASIHFAHSRS